MAESNFTRIYDRFKLQFYRKVFELVRERDGSLSAMEAFSLEVIHMLDHPTISQFADFLNISQSNATYKVNNLIRKGYIERENSTTDRREYHLNPTEKFYNYIGLYSDYQKVVLERVSKRFTAEDTAKFEEMLGIIVDELMPECEK